MAYQLLSMRTTVYHLVRDRILSYGQTASAGCSALVSSDPVLRRRTQEIIEHLARCSPTVVFGFLSQPTRGDLDWSMGLDAGQTRHPDINVAAYQRCSTVTPATCGNELISVRNRTDLARSIICLCELGFRGNEQNYYERTTVT